MNFHLKALLIRRSLPIIVFFLFILSYTIVHAGTREDLETLRNQCLYYSIGHAPTDTNTKTIRFGLYAQSPFSVPSTEIDIAASGFSLAALPSAVENGLISKNSAENIAKTAAQRILVMVEKSASALSPQEIEKYGFKGMLYHYYLWSENDQEYQGESNVEVSSIDTAILMFGLLVCGNYFRGDVLNDYRSARDLIRWKDWLDTSTPGHLNQFRMSYTNGAFSIWWNWRSEETMLICLLAAMSDSTLNIKDLWNAWEKELVTYNSPGPDSLSFTCYATWNGDPFTVFYGLHFIKFRKDFNGINWFSQSQIAYMGHVEFFKKERGYLDYMTFAFSNGSNGAIAKPKSNPDPSIEGRIDCPIYSLAGGLDYYSKNPDFNAVANTISLLVQNDNFLEWTGWPPESVYAKTSEHNSFNHNIIGQNIASIAISIDNYLTNRIRNIVMQDRDMKRIFNIVMPPNSTSNMLLLLLD